MGDFWYSNGEFIDCVDVSDACLGADVMLHHLNFQCLALPTLDFIASVLLSCRRSWVMYLTLTRLISSSKLRYIYSLTFVIFVFQSESARVEAFSKTLPTKCTVFKTVLISCQNLRNAWFILHVSYHCFFSVSKSCLCLALTAKSCPCLALVSKSCLSLALVSNSCLCFASVLKSYLCLAFAKVLSSLSSALVTTASTTTLVEVLCVLG